MHTGTGKKNGPNWSGSQPHSEIHGWYHFVFGFPPTLVDNLLDRLQVKPGDTVLDPFCGSGTTLVQCKRQGIDSIGIEANPWGVILSRVKVQWHIQPEKVRQLCRNIVSAVEARIAGQTDSCQAATALVQRLRTARVQSDPVYRHFNSSGMVERGWISELPLLKAIYLKQEIESQVGTGRHRDLLMVALASTTVADGANVKYGPEIYCVAPKIDADLVTLWAQKVDVMAHDLDLARLRPQTGRTSVLHGDARKSDVVLRRAGIPGSIQYVVTSPPYPADHDYTRNTRIELTLLGHVNGSESLRRIKKLMLRSHSKSVYADDDDGVLVENIPSVAELEKQIRLQGEERQNGFAKRYPVVVREYFGGMYRHLKSVASILSSGGLCAYVVGDQASFLGVHIATAEVLQEIVKASDTGLEVDGIETIGTRWATKTRKPMEEKVLYLRKRVER